ncbi:porin [Citreimonas salinaria]|uniref:Outer membrane protein OmpU n=1 Tax=Citreimonas salinaria TaxID=321339 RepID=A0A1H3HPK6_9RHOB|nr:porin [Citreimonas salinaria]SDY16609.1 outer membrane protein OmpU [Citreimonas salinaria]
MKKILFATTALVASAGIASAQGVEVSGTAEVGIVGGDRYDAADPILGYDNDNVDQLWTDVEVTFTMTGEADNGLTFGASVQLDEAPGPHGTDDDGATWFLAFGGARLDMGDTDGAFDAAMTEVGLVGTIDDTETAHAGYNGNAGLDGFYDGQIARFSYSYDAFTGHVSVEIDDTGEDAAVYGIGFSYAADLAGVNLGFGIGHQQTEIDNNSFRNVLVPGSDGDYSVTGASLSATTDAGIQVVLNYSEYNQENWDETMTHSAIGVAYTMNALSLGVNYGVYDDVNGVDGDETSGYAVSMNYDLGGGLVVQAGYAESDVDAGGVDETGDNYSLGLAMSF